MSKKKRQLVVKSSVRKLLKLWERWYWSGSLQATIKEGWYYSRVASGGFRAANPWASCKCKYCKNPRQDKNFIGHLLRCEGPGWLSPTDRADNLLKLGLITPGQRASLYYHD